LCILYTNEISSIEQAVDNFSDRQKLRFLKERLTIVEKSA